MAETRTDGPPSQSFKALLPVMLPLVALFDFPQQMLGLVFEHNRLLQPVVDPLVAGAVIAALETHRRGEQPTLSGALSQGLRWYWPLFVAELWVGLLITAGFLALIVPGLLLCARWSFALPIVALEGRGVVAAMGRSAVLSRGYRWRVFWLTVAVYAVQAVCADVLVPHTTTVLDGGSLGATIVQLSLILVLSAANVLWWIVVYRLYKDAEARDASTYRA